MVQRFRSRWRIRLPRATPSGRWSNISICLIRCSLTARSASSRPCSSGTSLRPSTKLMPRASTQIVKIGVTRMAGRQAGHPSSSRRSTQATRNSLKAFNSSGQRIRKQFLVNTLTAIATPPATCKTTIMFPLSLRCQSPSSSNSGKCRASGSQTWSTSWLTEVKLTLSKMRKARMMAV